MIDLSDGFYNVAFRWLFMHLQCSGFASKFPLFSAMISLCSNSFSVLFCKGASCNSIKLMAWCMACDKHAKEEFILSTVRQPRPPWHCDANREDHMTELDHEVVKGLCAITKTPVLPRWKFFMSITLFSWFYWGFRLFFELEYEVHM